QELVIMTDMVILVILPISQCLSRKLSYGSGHLSDRFLKMLGIFVHYKFIQIKGGIVNYAD
ncbi:MAG: hypothetical protein J6R06_08310, partial [Bacteroidales bacterium]|nr:hypothetical protein [Bacteroidales bacterium]